MAPTRSLREHWRDARVPTSSRPRARIAEPALTVSPRVHAAAVQGPLKIGRTSSQHPDTLARFLSSRTDSGANRGGESPRIVIYHPSNSRPSHLSSGGAHETRTTPYSLEPHEARSIVHDTTTRGRAPMGPERPYICYVAIPLTTAPRGHASDTTPICTSGIQCARSISNSNDGDSGRS